MKKHTITEELLRELHSEADLPLREKIENEVPGLFEPVLEVGKWYKSYYYLILYLGDDRCVGFDLSDMSWQDELQHYLHQHIDGSYKPATDEEVKAALIGEAKKRGYKPGNFESLTNVSNDVFVRFEDWHYESYSNNLYTASRGNGGSSVFHNGTWASIIEQPAQNTPQEVADVIDNYRKTFETFLTDLRNDVEASLNKLKNE